MLKIGNEDKLHAYSATMSPAEETKQREREGERFLARLKPDAYVIALRSMANSVPARISLEQLDKLATNGRSHVAFVIGGSTGLAPAVLQRAQQKLSFCWAYDLAAADDTVGADNTGV